MSKTRRSRAQKNGETSEEDISYASRPTKRQASVYDAVAGRIGSNGFIDDKPPQIKLRKGFPSRDPAFTPLEVLLRRVSAPTEGRRDVYFADEMLGHGQRLPESELLKAIHAYASDFYSMATENKGQCDFRSLDETALIALGILLEETAVQVLGETGDMVLVEPEQFDNAVLETRATQLQIHGQVPQVDTPPYASEESSEDSDDVELMSMREMKRRRAQEDAMS